MFVANRLHTHTEDLAGLVVGHGGDEQHVFADEDVHAQQQVLPLTPFASSYRVARQRVEVSPVPRVPDVDAAVQTARHQNLRITLAS